MGKVDTVTKAYMRKNNIFADAFNYLIYEGKTVVEPEPRIEPKVERTPEPVRQQDDWDDEMEIPTFLRNKRR